MKYNLQSREVIHGYGNIKFKEPKLTVNKN